MKKQTIRIWKYFLFFFFFLWTGILFFHIARQYFFTKNLETQLIHLLIKESNMNIGVLKAVHSNTDIISAKLLQNSYHILNYTAQNNPSNSETKKKSSYSLLENPVLASQETTKETSDAIPVSDLVLFDNGSSDITSKNHSGIEQERDIAESITDDSNEALRENQKKIKTLYKTYSRDKLLKNFYITDSSTSIDNNVFQVKKLLTMDLRLKQEKKPQILIIHTHGASEAFKDSKNGKEDSIIGVGSKLAEILSKKYGYQVIHDKTEYDRIGGTIDRNKAYNMSYAGTKKTLKQYPSIQLVIDLHRDGVGYKVNRTTILDGKKTAQVMFFNGLSRTSRGNIEYLKNPNLQGNLAFSLQLKLACMRHFKDFAKAIYLKGYRYNMHLMARYTLIELGNENNTVAEAKNAAAPLALVIHEVLTKSP